eukprot:gene27474-33883_t
MADVLRVGGWVSTAEGQTSRLGSGAMADGSLESSAPSQSPQPRRVTMSPGIASNARLKVQLDSESCDELLSESSPVEAPKPGAAASVDGIMSKYKNPIFG